MKTITELRAAEFAARKRLTGNGAEFHADPRGYWVARAEAEAARDAAKAALDAARPCRFCDAQAITERWAGSYGTALVCAGHIETARTLAADTLAGERANGAALAQMSRDERAMMRVR